MDIIWAIRELCKGDKGFATGEDEPFCDTFKKFEIK